MPDATTSTPLLCTMPFCSASVLSKIYVFDPRPHFPLRIVAKRYWIEEPCPDASDHNLPNAQEDALTLVFIPGNGAHKEHWEPTIQRLFENQQTATRRPVRFHDMWSLDMPNHGDSAILNEETLQWGYDICKVLHSFRGHGRQSHFLWGVLSFVGGPCARRPCLLSGARGWRGC